MKDLSVVSITRFERLDAYNELFSWSKSINVLQYYLDKATDWNEYIRYINTSVTSHDDQYFLILLAGNPAVLLLLV